MFRKVSTALLILFLVGNIGFARQAKSVKEQSPKGSEVVQNNTWAQRVAATQLSKQTSAPLDEGFEGGAIPITWTVYDFDGDAKEWTVLQSATNAHSGDYHASISFNAAGNNDWLITPALVPVSGDSVAFWARSRSATFPEDFNIRLSSTGLDSADFSVTLEAVQDLGIIYQRFVYSLESYVGDTVYVAIQNISVDEWELWVDDVTGPEVYLPPFPSFTTPATDVNLNQNNGLIAVGNSAMHAVPITNTGGGDLTISDITTSSSDITTDVTSLVIAGGATDEVMVTWAPSTVAMETGWVAFTHDGTSSPDTVTFSLHSVAEGSFVIDFEAPTDTWFTDDGYGFSLAGGTNFGSTGINNHWGVRGMWFPAASSDTVTTWSAKLDLTTGPIEMGFYHRGVTSGTGDDSIDVIVSTDMGATWDVLGTLSNSVSAFEYVTFDLSAYAGNDGVWVGWDFRFPTGQTTGSSWYMDDLALPNRAAIPLPVEKLLITEIVVTPTEGEFIEIYNPGAGDVELTNYYLTDATFQGGNTYYYQIVEGAGGGGAFGDFHSRFPDGAMIAAGEYQTIALSGDSSFFATHGVLPTYELWEDSTDFANDVPNMLEAFSGSIGGQGGLTNGDEVVILYNWDGESDLVTDIDYLLYNSGSPVANNEFVDKTGVMIDGPDIDSDSSMYAPDTPGASQMSALNNSVGFSVQRIDMSEGAQSSAGGNGLDGRDETSEDLNNTFVNNTAPTPNGAYVPPTPAPTGLTANAGNAVVDLSWMAPGMLEKLIKKSGKAVARADQNKAIGNDDDNNVTTGVTSALIGYKVYRSEDNTTYAQQDSVGETSTMYSDVTVTNGTTYYYYVTAVYDEGESASSDTVMATPSAAVVLFEEVFGDTLPPAGWQVIDNDGSGAAWEFRQIVAFSSGDTVFPQAGQSFWFSNFNNANGFLIDEWLISPQIPAGNYETLSFYAGSIGGSFPDSLKVLVSTTTSNPADFTEIAYVVVPGPTGSWNEFSFDISAFSGSSIYVAINYYITNGGPSGNNSDNVWVDHLTVTGEALPPVGLNPARHLGGFGGDQEAQLSWLAPLPDGELGYDDGSAETGFGFNGTGAFATRFTPNVYPATLLGIKTYWSNIPAPLDSVEYAVWVNPTGGDNPPATQVLGPVDYEVPARSAFSTVDISGSAIQITEGDFYFAWNQPVATNYGIGLDTDGADYERAWISFDGVSWSKLNSFGYDDNLLIRAIVQEGTGKNARIVELPPVKASDLLSRQEKAALQAQNDHLFASQQLVADKKQAQIEKRNSATITDLNGYNIYRSLDASAYTLVGSADTVEYIDSGLDNGVDYYYYVTAVYSEGESNPSNVAMVTTGGTSEPQAFLTHTPGDLNASIFNNGYVGSTSTVGDGVIWKGQNGLYSGGLIFGTATVGSVNGLIPSFSIDGDLLNVNSNFAAGFTSDSNFDQVTTAVLNDSGAPVPYGMEIVQNSYSNTGEEFMIIRYGFVNKSGAAVSDLYAGITIDWDIADYLTNLGGYSLPENMVYQYDNAGYYYGMSVLDKNEFSGARVTLDSPAPDARTGSFEFITTLDVNSVTDPGDYRTWLGAGPFSANVGDTVWATFAVVAGDDLQGLRDNAYAASQKALSVGFIDVSVGIGDDDQLPTVFSLEQNYPNPFNPSTTLKYALPTNADVRLEIYNVLGQLVKVLVDADQTAGFKTAIWDGTNQYGEKVASGIYIYRIKAAEFVQSKKMILMK